MEQHRYELDHENESKEEHKDQTDGFQLQVLFLNMNLQNKLNAVRIL